MSMYSLTVIKEIKKSTSVQEDDDWLPRLGSGHFCQLQAAGFRLFDEQEALKVVVGWPQARGQALDDSRGRLL